MTCSSILMILTFCFCFVDNSEGKRKDGNGGADGYGFDEEMGYMDDGVRADNLSGLQNEKVLRQ